LIAPVDVADHSAHVTAYDLNACLVIGRTAGDVTSCSALVAVDLVEVQASVAPDDYPVVMFSGVASQVNDAFVQLIVAVTVGSGVVLVYAAVVPDFHATLTAVHVIAVSDNPAVMECVNVHAAEIQVHVIEAGGREPRMNPCANVAAAVVRVVADVAARVDAQPFLEHVIRVPSPPPPPPPVNLSEHGPVSPHVSAVTEAPLNARGHRFQIDAFLSN